MKIYFKLFFLLSPLTCNAQDVLLHTANFLCDGVDLYIEVNGFPVAHLPESGTSGTSANGIGQYFLKGVNEVKVLATPQPKDASKEDKGCLWNFVLNSGPTLDSQKQVPDLRIERSMDPAAAEPNGRVEIEVDGQMIAQLRHIGINDGGNVTIEDTTNRVCYTPAIGPTSAFVAKLNLPNVPLDSLPWLTPQVAPQGSDEAAIRQLVADLNTAIGVKNWQTVRALLAVKFARIAATSGTTIDDIFEISVDHLNRITTSDAFAMRVLDVDQLQIQLIGTLNLARVTMAGKAPIHGQGSEYSLDVPVFVSRIDGVWRIVD